MQRLSNPIPLFLDARGDLLDAGQIFIGVAGQDPEINPLAVFWDGALSIPVAQPIRTSGGVIVNGANPAYVFFPNGDYSLRIRDADGNQVTYVPSVAAVSGATANYQPLSANLSALSAIVGTGFGLSLLTLTNAAALRAAAGIAASLPLTGGTVTGPITRSGSGVHAYFADSSMTGGRIFVTAVGATDPTSQPGDIWLQY